MNHKTVHTRPEIIALIVFAVAFSRLLPLGFGLTGFFNISPLTGLALFGSAYFSKRLSAFALPFLALWLSNVLIDNVFYTSFYKGFAWFANWEVYLAFGLVVCLGLAFLKKITPLRVAGASLTASVLFFVVTNFFVWFNYEMYPKNAAGLLLCYEAALPFFQKTLIGDLFYAGVLFGAFEWVKSRKPVLVLQNLS